MSALATLVQGILAADAQMQSACPGGIHMDEISRQKTPTAFDANGELLPCAVVRVSAETAAGPYRRSGQAFINVYFYQRTGYTAIDAGIARAFEILNDTRPGENIWEMRWVDDVPDQEDPVLQCSMAVSRYQITRLR